MSVFFAGVLNKLKIRQRFHFPLSSRRLQEKYVYIDICLLILNVETPMFRHKNFQSVCQLKVDERAHTRLNVD